MQYRCSAVYLGSNGSGGIYLTNNTVISNTTDDAVGTIISGLRVRISNTSNAFITNNNLWGNDGNDAHIVDSGGNVLYDYNNAQDAFDVPALIFQNGFE